MAGEARAGGRRWRQDAALACFALGCAGIWLAALLPPSVAHVPAGPATVKDMNGREVPLAAPARKAVIYPPMLADYLTIDQGAAHVAATARPNLATAREGLMGDLFPALPGLPVTGPTVDPSDPEVILQMDPDAVFAWSHATGSLRGLGRPGLFLVTLPAGDPQKPVAMLRMIGRVAGKEARTEALLKSYRDRMDALRALAAAQGGPRPRVAILNGSDGAWWLGGGKSYYLNLNLRWAQAENAAKNAFLPVDRGDLLENLLLLDPDCILVNSGQYHGTPRDLYRKPMYQAVRAVRQRRVYLMPEYLDTSMLLRDPLLQIWMTGLFHPAAALPDLRQACRDACRDLYGYALGEDQLDRLLCLDDNLGSAGYARWARQPHP